MHIGIAGEVRCVVTNADGTVKTDTGFQKNLILNQGLDFFGGGRGSTINAICAIGSGNSTPTITQNKLDSFIALTVASDTTTDFSYKDDGDNLYKMWQQRKYRFANLDSANISEVGLVSTGSTSTDYYLTTRALIKDSTGEPTSISVKTGETLDIYYKIHKVVDTRDKEFIINMLDGNGASIPYNATHRPVYVGANSWNTPTNSVVIPNDVFYSLNDISSITAYPSRINLGDPSVTMSSYVIGSYKIVMTFFFPLNVATTGIRTIFSLDSFRFLPFQIRFGSVENDSMIDKNNKNTLTIPLEFSWGRYEGEL